MSQTGKQQKYNIQSQIVLNKLSCIHSLVRAMLNRRKEVRSVDGMPRGLIGMFIRH